MFHRSEIIQNNLKEIRTRTGMRQKDLATLLGFTSEERVSLWEQGKKAPGLDNLILLCNIFQVELKDLYVELAKEKDDEVKMRMKDAGQPS